MVGWWDGDSVSNLLSSKFPMPSTLDTCFTSRDRARACA